MRHHRPFHRGGLLHIVAHEAVQPVVGLARKTRAEDEDRSQRAGFAADRRAGAIVVVPDLRRGERHEQAEDDAERG
jgi:hypothetical protein